MFANSFGSISRPSVRTATWNARGSAIGGWLSTPEAT
jgi:hypothetical protein